MVSPSLKYRLETPRQIGKFGQADRHLVVPVGGLHWEYAQLAPSIALLKGPIRAALSLGLGCADTENVSADGRSHVGVAKLVYPSVIEEMCESRGDPQPNDRHRRLHGRM